MAETLCVTPGRIEEIWPHIEPWFAKAVAQCGDWTVDAIREGVGAERMLLWILWDGEALKAAAVTQLIIVPRGKVCTVVACGGSAAGSWKSAISPIEKYAKEEGCVSMRIQGRVAWTRVFDDYDLEWVALEKRLD